MSGLRPPGPLSLEGNLAKNYADWIREFNVYEIATQLTDKPEKVRCATFLHVAGPQAQAIHQTLTFTRDEVNKIEPLKLKFKEYCEPKRNITVIRYLFNTRNQHNGEPFTKFVTDLKRLARDCEFDALEESLMKDRIVCGIRDSTLREKLLQIDNLTLKQCLDICTVAEASAEQIKQLAPQDNTGKDDEAVDAVGTQARGRPRPRGRGDGGRWQRGRRRAEDRRAPYCKYCAYNHADDERCPAEFETCNSCGREGHFSRSALCPRNNDDRRNQRGYGDRNERDQRYGRGNRQRRDVDVREVEANAHGEQYDDCADTGVEQATAGLHEDFDTFYISEITGKDNKDNEWTQSCKIGDTDINFKLDTGSQVDIIPEHIFAGLDLSLKKSRIILRSYSGHKMEPVGEVTAEVRVGKNNHVSTFQVVRGNVKAILGKKTCEELGLLERKSVHAVKGSVSDVGQSRLIEKNEDLFGLGRLRRHEYDIKLRNDVQPVKNPPRTIPHKLRDEIQKELQRMEQLGVIARVNEPTEWVNSMTYVRKPSGAVRICLDPRNLNEAIQREHYPMPTFEQVAARMPNASTFSKFDATSGYWQLPLTERSSVLTTFNTPFGRYRYKVLPFGVSSASEIWQRAMMEEFGQLEGVEVVADDVLVWGECKEQHDERLGKFFEKVRESGLKLNKAKSIVGTHRVEYVGHVISKEGIVPSPDRVESVTLSCLSRQMALQSLCIHIHYSVRQSVRPSVLPSVHSFQNASSSSFLNRFWFWLFHKIGLGGGFKTSTQNCEIHYLW